MQLIKAPSDRISGIALLVTCQACGEEQPRIEVALNENSCNECFTHICGICGCHEFEPCLSLNPHDPPCFWIGATQSICSAHMEELSQLVFEEFGTHIYLWPSGRVYSRPYESRRQGLFVAA